MSPQVSHIHHGGKKDHRKILASQKKKEIEKAFENLKKEKGKSTKFKSIVTKFRDLFNENDHSLFIN